MIRYVYAGTAAQPKIDTTSCPSGFAESAARSDVLAATMRDHTIILNAEPHVDFGEEEMFIEVPPMDPSVD